MLSSAAIDILIEALGKDIKTDEMSFIDIKDRSYFRTQIHKHVNDIVDTRRAIHCIIKGSEGELIMRFLAKIWKHFGKIPNEKILIIDGEYYDSNVIRTFHQYSIVMINNVYELQYDVIGNEMLDNIIKHMQSGEAPCIILDDTIYYCDIMDYITTTFE
jgi:hypothetical protein